jgi:predicted phosphoribosyltransferase
MTEAKTRKIEEPPFADRSDAGRQLATRLSAYKDDSNLLVLALPRGGVPVAYEVARQLHAPLDIFIVRKIGAPGQKEFAIGAIATGGVRVLTTDADGFPTAVIEQIIEDEQQELHRRENLYRRDRPAAGIRDRTIILVDDGLATGASMQAAAMALRQMKPRKIVAAVPVGPPETCEAFRHEFDEVVCAVSPEGFMAVGSWYADFTQVSDEEVIRLLELSR